MALEDVIDELVRECGARAYSFSLNWSEAEWCFYAGASGLGKGEFVEVKRVASMLGAAKRLLALVKEEAR